MNVDYYKGTGYADLGIRDLAKIRDNLADELSKAEEELAKRTTLANPLDHAANQHYKSVTAVFSKQYGNDFKTEYDFAVVGMRTAYSTTRWHVTGQSEPFSWNEFLEFLFLRETEESKIDAVTSFRVVSYSGK